MPPPPSSSSSSSSSSTKASPSPPPPPPPQSPLFLPINETEDEEEEEEEVKRDQHCITREQTSTATADNKPNVTKQTTPYHHNPTPLHHTATSTPTATTGNVRHSTRRRPVSGNPNPEPDPDDRSVACNKCRPTSKEKISSISSSTNPNPSPNNLFRSLVSTITRKSPRSSSASASEISSTVREDQWKLAVAELSHKLIQATKKRDDALLEASRLKFSMSELEKKLNKLEIYCHELKSGLDSCSNNAANTGYQIPKDRVGHRDKIVESFVNSVSDSRSSVRLLSRSLTLQLRQMGGKVQERISKLLEPYDVKISIAKNPRGLLFYLEALLNRTFYEDFEGTGFQKSGSVPVLNPIERCEANYSSFTVLQKLSWDEVLNKGTRHFSEEFSRFCDRKMSEIVAMLGWNRAWPEPLLQAFFGAAKNVWLVHLLACAVHPSLPIFRVEKDVRFDGVYMEDMGGDKGRKLVPVTVRIMVAPGFYVYSNVVKCKVLCRYSNNQEMNHLGGLECKR